MKASKFTEAQIAFVLKQAEGGTAAAAFLAAAPGRATAKTANGVRRSTLEYLCNKPEGLRLVSLDIPVAGGAAENLIHSHL